MGRNLAKRLAQEAIQQDRPLEWFEELYSQATDSGSSLIPWADARPNPNLVEWLDREGTEAKGRSALVVGCGLGDDAEELGRRGFAVTAFDISKSAVAMACRRFPDSPVEYSVANLLSPPPGFSGKFDFVQETYTLQVMPRAMRPAAIERIASFVAPGGTLLVIARARDDSEGLGDMPWPLSRAELSYVLECGLEQSSFEDYFDSEMPPVRRFRATYRCRYS